MRFDRRFAARIGNALGSSCCVQAGATITRKHDKKGHLMSENQATKLRMLFGAYADARIMAHLVVIQVGVPGPISPEVNRAITRASGKVQEVRNEIEDFIKELRQNG